MRIIPPVEIAVLDDRGAVVSEPGIRVTIRLHRNNTYGEQGRLYGTKTVMTINGIATFADLSIDKAWAETKNGYTLLARAPSLLDAVSGSFAVLPGSPAALQVVMSAGWNPYQQPVVAGQTFWVWADVVDQGGNYVSGDTRLITIRLSGGPAEATLSGPTSVNAVDGEAFFEVSIDRPGTDYRITATATDLREAVVGPFAVVAAVSGAARR